jgi:hypothetical protein
MDDFAAFARLLDALRPWLGHLVVVGGWAHRLHRFHPLAHVPAHAPVRTKDADIAFSDSVPLSGDIATALKAADFHEEFLGEHTPLLCLDTGSRCERDAGCPSWKPLPPKYSTGGLNRGRVWVLEVRHRRSAILRRRGSL